MFDSWPDQFTPPLRSVVDPPRPVIVDLAVALPTRPEVFGLDAVPLRVKSGGLRVVGSVPGQLHAWARTHNGAWIGLASFVLETGNKQGQIQVTQWCSAAALSAAETPSPPRQ